MAGEPSSPPAAAKSPSPPAEVVVAGILPASHWTEQALGEDDGDSAYGDVESSTASISSSILKYRNILGRRYHSDAHTDSTYWGPNDERQQESADIVHHTLTTLEAGPGEKAKLFRSPLKTETLQKVLDVGTGTGIWAIDFADEYPHAEVIGTDLSPIQPTWIPPNVKFEIEDATKAWTFAEDSFDFVFARYLFGSLPDWDEFFRQAYRVTKPCGYVESFEASCVFHSDDGSVVEGSSLDQWGKVFAEGGRKFGRPFTVVEEHLQEKGFKAAGFTDITVHDGKCPIGPWPLDPKLKEIGLYSRVAVEKDIEGYVLFMWSQVMGWKPEEIQVYIAHVRKELRDPKIHGHFKYRVVYGRKPE